MESAVSQNMLVSSSCSIFASWLLGLLFGGGVFCLFVRVFLYKNIPCLISKPVAKK